jgi:hypothetical protein
LHRHRTGVFGRFFLFLTAFCRQGDIHLRCGTSALTGVSLVNENGEALAAMLVANLV